MSVAENESRMLRVTVFAAVLATFGVSGCASLGPRRLAPDRMDYIQEINESAKQQMLLNIVKLRYFDPPAFLDITSVINQYSREGQIQADARWYWPRPATSAANAGGGGLWRFSDRPTITYVPLSGRKFTQNLLTPIPPVAVVSLIQSGWSIELLFSLTVKTVNGVNNSSVGAPPAPGETEFSRLVKALRAVQLAGVSDIRVKRIGEQETIVFVISEKAGQTCLAERETIRKVLNLNPDVTSYKVAYGSLASDDNEIALQTRSMLEIMLEMAAHVDAPAAHIAEKRVKETAPLPDNEWMATQIHSSREKPADAFAAVQYQDYWFWIDNRDINSKRNFALVMIFMSLTEADQRGSGPLLTIGG